MNHCFVLNVANILKKNPAKSEQNIKNLLSLSEDNLPFIFLLLLDLDNNEKNKQIKDAIRKVVHEEAYQYYVKKKLQDEDLAVIDKIYSQLSAVRQIKLKEKIQSQKMNPDFINAHKPLTEMAFITRELKNGNLEPLQNLLKIKEKMPTTFMVKIIAIYEKTQKISNEDLSLLVDLYHKSHDIQHERIINLMMKKLSFNQFKTFIDSIKEDDFFNNLPNFDHIENFNAVKIDIRELNFEENIKLRAHTLTNMNYVYSHFKEVKNHPQLSKEQFPFSFIVENLDNLYKKTGMTWTIDSYIDENKRSIKNIKDLYLNVRLESNILAQEVLSAKIKI